MKKLLITLFVVMSFMLTFTCYAISGQYETIKLGLFFDSTAKASVTLNSDLGFVIGYTQNGEFITVADTPQTELYVLINGSGVMEVNAIYQNTGYVPLEIYSYDDVIKVNGTAYRGSIILIQNGSAMTVINEVGLDEYLYSVIGKEMSPSWHIEALKAQAICARTYAINNWNKYASKGFNLCTTQASQVYGGLSGETPRTVQAVNETAGQIVKYNGKIAQTFFYSSSGGKTANVKYVWGSEFPYLVCVDDPYEDAVESSREWTVTFSREQIAQKCANAGVDVGNVQSIHIAGVDNGTVYNVVIKGDRGEYVLKNERVRTFFGLKSQYFTINSGAQDASASIEMIKDTLPSFFRTNANKIVQMLNSNAVTYAPVNADTFVFKGQGWGHRIGMSQYGAKKMAENGFSAAEILMHYFPGTTVE